MMDFVIEIISGKTALAIYTAIAISVVSSWITVKLSTQQFRTQRWWERKVEAYEKIVETLHNLKMFSEQHLKADYRGIDLPEEKDAELRKRSRLAHDEIEKVIDTGAFLLSDNAMARLRQYRKEAARATETTNWTEYLEADLDATYKCLNDMIEIAKSDLKTK